MQIIEVTDLAVRSAVIRLRRRESRLQFVVYPMIHMAQPGFYKEVTRRLGQADVVVLEGVGAGPAPGGGAGAGGGSGRRKGSVLFGALTFSYTALRFNRKAKLVEQDIDYGSLGAELVHPDVDTAEFETGWRRAPLRQRLMMWLVLPVVVLVRLFGGTRMIWSRSMEQNDLPSALEEAQQDRYPDLVAAFGGERDERLLAALYRLHDERATEDIEVAVVYGAAHVPAIVHGLRDRYGYRARSADWLTVADL